MQAQQAELVQVAPKPAPPQQVNPNLLTRSVLRRFEGALSVGADAPGATVALSGDAALARGLLEAGARIVTSYPGAPACQYPDLLAACAEQFGTYVEWSVNEKVALEVAAAGAMAGLRTCYGGKDLGMNVASDTIMQLCYGGVEGGMVMIAATDVGAFVSSGEFDCRLYPNMFKFIGLDPADPQEAKDMLVAAFGISERVKLPVMLLVTGEVAWRPSRVEFGRLPQVSTTPSLPRDTSRWRAGGPVVLGRKRWQRQQLGLMKEIAEELPFNRLDMRGHEQLGIITTGVASNYVREVKERFGLDELAVLKLGCFYPLPERLLDRFLSQVERVLVVELLDPYVEKAVHEFASFHGKPVGVRGKLTGDLPEEGAYSFELVAGAISQFIGRPLATTPLDKADLRKRILETVPDTRNPCPGCPHRASYFALKQALRQLGKDPLIIPDTGCSSSAGRAMNMGDIKLNLGSSLGLMSGFRQAGIEDKEIVACIGDSAFLHGGIPPLFNMSQHGVDGTVVVMDNDCNAATGHQPSGSSGVTALGWDTKKANFAQIARACNVDAVQATDPYQLRTTQAALVETLSKKHGQKLVVLSRECAYQAVTRRKVEAVQAPRFYVKEDQCCSSKICVSEFGCPAIYLKDTGKAAIDDALCFGCGVCLEVCPSYAFRRAE
jgi:indolepyruvate ferredoxin oxidoreductase alpha subunit